MNLKKLVSNHKSIYRWAVDTFSYLSFWTLIGYVIQVNMVGISVQQYILSSILGTIATLILARPFGKYLDFLRYRLDRYFEYDSSQKNRSE